MVKIEARRLYGDLRCAIVQDTCYSAILGMAARDNKMFRRMIEKFVKKDGNRNQGNYKRILDVQRTTVQEKQKQQEEQINKAKDRHLSIACNSIEKILGSLGGRESCKDILAMDLDYQFSMLKHEVKRIKGCNDAAIKQWATEERKKFADNYWKLVKELYHEKTPPQEVSVRINDIRKTILDQASTNFSEKLRSRQAMSTEELWDDCTSKFQQFESEVKKIGGSHQSHELDQESFLKEYTNRYKAEEHVNNLRDHFLAASVVNVRNLLALHMPELCHDPAVLTELEPILKSNSHKMFNEYIQAVANIDGGTLQGLNERDRLQWNDTEWKQFSKEYEYSVQRHIKIVFNGMQDAKDRILAQALNGFDEKIRTGQVMSEEELSNDCRNRFIDYAYEIAKIDGGPLKGLDMQSEAAWQFKEYSKFKNDYYDLYRNIQQEISPNDTVDISHTSTSSQESLHNGEPGPFVAEEEEIDENDGALVHRSRNRHPEAV